MEAVYSDVSLSRCSERHGLHRQTLQRALQMCSSSQLFHRHICISMHQATVLCGGKNDVVLRLIQRTLRLSWCQWFMVSLELYEKGLIVQLPLFMVPAQSLMGPHFPCSLIPPVRFSYLSLPNNGIFLLLAFEINT